MSPVYANDAPGPWKVRPPTDATFRVADGVHADGTSWASQLAPPQLADGDGDLPAGAFCLVADHALAAALARSIHPDQAVVTTHLDLTVTRPVRAARRVVAHGRLLAVTDTGTFATATISDEQGALVAHATGRFALLSAHPAVRAAVAPVPAAPEDETRALHGAPLHSFLGTRVLSAEQGRAHVTFTAEPGFANAAANLHGGVAGLLGEVASAVALHSAGAPASMQVVGVRVTYLRPIPLRGEPIHVLSKVTHLGRTMAVVRSDVSTGDERAGVGAETIHTLPEGVA